MAPAACPCARARVPGQCGRAALPVPAAGTCISAFLVAPAPLFAVRTVTGGVGGRPRTSIARRRPAGGGATAPPPAGRRAVSPPVAALGSDDGPAPPRFRVDGAEAPKSRFGPAPTPPSTPNERAAAAVAETMERLGVAAAAAPATPATPRGPGRRVDLRTVNAGGAAVGAAGAAALFWALWTATTWLAGWYGAHPVTGDGGGGYVVARISVVVRTAVVGLVALAAGMSGVTGMGLALLAGRVAVGRVTGVWPEVEPGGGGEGGGGSAGDEAGRSGEGGGGGGK